MHNFEIARKLIELSIPGIRIELLREDEEASSTYAIIYGNNRELVSESNLGGASIGKFIFKLLVNGKASPKVFDDFLSWFSLIQIRKNWSVTCTQYDQIEYLRVLSMSFDLAYRYVKSKKYKEALEVFNSCF